MHQMRLPLLFLTLSALAASPISAASSPNLRRVHHHGRVLRADNEPATENELRGEGEGRGKAPGKPRAPENVAELTTTTDNNNTTVFTTTTKDPSSTPTVAPSSEPTDAPTTKDPSSFPTESPSNDPTKAPTNSPTDTPTKDPSASPTDAPTTKDPSSFPTESPSNEPTEAPTNSPTDTPTEGPSSSPTFTPGSVQRFFCTEDEEPLQQDKYCNEEEKEGSFWYTEYDKCDEKCKGKKSCSSIRCVTEVPTVSPSMSVSPSVATSSSPSVVGTTAPSVTSTSPTLSPTTLSPTVNSTTDVLVVGETTTSTASDNVLVGETVSSITDPTPPKFSFILPENEEVEPPLTTVDIPLSLFQLDFAIVTTAPSVSSNDPHRQRQLLVRGGDYDRQLSYQEYNLFQKDQELELLSLVSTHLLLHFKKNLDGEPTDVQLAILTKSERVMGSGGEVTFEDVDQQEGGGVDTVMASITLIGYAVYEVIDDDESSLPTTADLDSEVLKAFSSEKGKYAWMKAVGYSEDAILNRIINVEASSNRSIIGSGSGSSTNQAKESDSGGSVVSSASNSDGDNNGAGPLALPFVILIASAFATTFVVIGLLTYRKYQRYSQNNHQNDYLSYQYRKKRSKLTIDTNAKKLKQYNHFESPEGSEAVVSQSEDPIYNDLEIVGGDTYPSMSQEESTSPIAAGKQFHPNDDNAEESAAPYDEEQTSAAYDMTYFANAANLMMNDESRDETLEGLYSDKDSYFQSSTIAPNSVSTSGQHHRRGDSIHSLDTLDNTFGFDTPSVSHLFCGIEEFLENDDANDADNNSLLQKKVSFDDDVLENPTTTSLSSISHRICEEVDENNIGDVFLTETTTKILSEENHVATNGDASEDDQDDEPVLEDEHTDIVSSEEITNNNDDILKWKYDNDVTPKVTHRKDQLHRVSEKSNDISEEQDGGVAAAEFESPNNTSEISTTDELYARITELENKILNTESQLARDDNMMLPMVTPTKIENKPATTSSDGVSEPAKAFSSLANTGLLTDKTLGMIEQSRLSGTPPPSEGEVDNEMIKEAKENTLLGKFLNQSDSEEDSVFSR